MILSALRDYYLRLQADPDSGISPPGYSQEKISYAIVLDAQGHLVQVDDLRQASGKKAVPMAMSVPQPEKRTAGIKPNLLWDKSSYVLGISASSKRAAQEHAAFKQRHQEALEGCDDIGLQSLQNFLRKWDPAHYRDTPQLQEHGDALLDANLVFRLDGERGYLHERPAARMYWSLVQSANDAVTPAMCLVIGKEAPIARLHPAIKGVNGAQSSGASIVSFNLDAFASYGKAQGDNAPVSEEAAFAYTTALNHLLRRDPANHQRVQIGDTTVVFWAQAAEPAQTTAAEALMAALLGTAETDVQATQRLDTVLEHVRQLRPLKELPERFDDGTRTFVLGLAPNASRLSIRFWFTDTLAEFAMRLGHHYRDLQLQPPAWRRAPTPGYLALQTAPIYKDGGKPKSEDVSPLLAGELTRAILAGSRYPHSLLATLVMRFRADGQITPLRVALCKAVLARDARLRVGDNQLPPSDSDQGARLVSLDPDNVDPGYLLGRLFSTLENVQRAALGKEINATIRDRYYGAASATPASIFPVLLRNAQNHFGKIRKEKPGLAVTLEKDVGQIVDRLPASLPRSLLIEAQGRFAIGYYHQTQSRYARNESSDTTDATSEGDAA